MPGNGEDHGRVEDLARCTVCVILVKYSMYIFPVFTVNVNHSVTKVNSLVRTRYLRSKHCIFTKMFQIRYLAIFPLIKL